MGLTVSKNSATNFDLKPIKINNHTGPWRQLQQDQQEEQREKVKKNFTVYVGNIGKASSKQQSFT